MVRRSWWPDIADLKAPRAQRGKERQSPPLTGQEESSGIVLQGRQVLEKLSPSSWLYYINNCQTQITATVPNNFQ